jgi:hypothetical protein
MSSTCYGHPSVFGKAVTEEQFSGRRLLLDIGDGVSRQERSTPDPS